MTSSTHEADFKGNISRHPIHPQSLVVMAFGTEGDKTVQKKAQSENEHIHSTYMQWFSFDFPCTRIPLKFHRWDWDLAKNQARKWELVKIWAGKWDLYPPPPPYLGPSKKVYQSCCVFNSVYSLMSCTHRCLSTH